MDTRTPVVVLGATGLVGKEMLVRLHDHKDFKVTHLAASRRSAGMRYRDLHEYPWKYSRESLSAVGDIVLLDAVEDLERYSGEVKMAFSALDAEIAHVVESQLVERGVRVFSNARPGRLLPHVPILIPGVNDVEQLPVGVRSKYVVNPNCVVAGLAIALKPLHDVFGITQVMVSTMQAISGAGYPGVPSLDIVDNVVVDIADEENKIESELLKVFGNVQGAEITSHPSMRVSAHAHRVLVTNGHTMAVSVKFSSYPGFDHNKLVQIFKTFNAETTERLQRAGASSLAGKAILKVHCSNLRPQPKLDRDLGSGLTVSVGKIRPCNVLDVKFVVVCNNLSIGAAGISVLNAEIVNNHLTH